MDRTCAACGKPVVGGIVIGGALLCQICEPDIREEIERIRTEGKQVNAMGVAKRIYRETYSAGNYILRDVPELMMAEMKELALKEKASVRDVIIVAISQYLAKNQKAD